VPGTDIALGDCEALFAAVTARLRRTAEAAPEAIMATLVDCIAALDQLHLSLSHELAFGEQHRREMAAVQAALVQSRSDLALLQAGERHALHRATHDGLTALPNRSFFEQRLERALAPVERQQAPPAVLFLDLDGFKAVNDQHGHAIGDELLRIVAMRLQRAVRSEDVVSRHGGDEFACLLANSVSREQLSHVACKLFDAVSAPLQIGALKLTVRPSIGIAVCPADGDTAGALLRSADAAMYQAKRQQSGYAFCKASA
jgi:diguanylate cyclase (GGDEF)-like protein